MYLAVAADMGLPALVIYLALFSSFFTMTLMAIRKARSIVKTLLRGLLCGMSAHMVYGLMDNYMLGEKLGFSVWLFFAVCTAIYIHRETLVHYYSEQPGEALNTTPRLFRQVARSRLRDLWWNVGAWLVISVIGISFILPHPLISLVITVSGGTLLGIVMTRRFELQYQGEHARPEARTSP
jgi:L-cystine uptake protein TcyP (sodium:dicarboxylate symporter family)